MKLDPEKYRALARFLVNTRPDEMTCEDWLGHVGQYVEHVLYGSPAPEHAVEIKQHIELCPECAEELCAIMTALKVDG